MLGRSPDVVISFILKMNVLSLAALRGSPVPVVISERTAPDYRFGLLSRTHFLRSIRASATAENWLVGPVRVDDSYLAAPRKD